MTLINMKTSRTCTRWRWVPTPTTQHGSRSLQVEHQIRGTQPSDLYLPSEELSGRRDNSAPGDLALGTGKAHFSLETVVKIIPTMNIRPMFVRVMKSTKVLLFRQDLFAKRQLTESVAMASCVCFNHTTVQNFTSSLDSSVVLGR